MNQKFLSGLTATLLITTLSAPSLGNTQPNEAVDPGSETSPKVASSPASVSPEESREVMKIGEQQSQTRAATSSEVVAKIQPHTLRGHKAATLYVRNIPVLTFIGSQKAESEDVKLGAQVPNSAQDEISAAAKSLTGIEELSLDKPLISSQKAIHATLTPPTPSTDPDDPVWRASEVAAKLNQMNREGVEASKISVGLDTQAVEGSGNRYLIKIDDDVLTVLDANTMSPDATRDREADALQTANRLRRLLGNAEPLSEVSGKPNQAQTLALGPIKLKLNGWASWYGPGFDGNLSASGEVFNQNAMTAAHRTLPFGTRVVVTNLDNGQSVVVRINDRGPYHGNRIIDLSAAAARMLGLIQTGVAPVRLDILDNRRSVTAGN